MREEHGLDGVDDVTLAEPKHKGVGMMAIIKALKANVVARARVPAHLASYLQEPIVATGWYPERDYSELITLLASCIDPKQVGGDVWAFFGRTAAQRDIGGEQHDVPERSRLAHVGIYRKFRDVPDADVAGLFSRMTRVWNLYHDTGRMVFMRHPTKPNALVVRLHDFSFPLRGLADLQTAYMLEYAKLSGFSLRGEHVASWPKGCEWYYELANQADLGPAMATLPPWEANSFSA